MRHHFLAVFLSFAAGVGSVQASPDIQPTVAALVSPQPDASEQIKAYGFTLAPLSFVKFCMSHGEECKPGESNIEPDTLSLVQLGVINREVNRAIAPQRKPTEPLRANWTIAPSAGDCNDYAVTKRHRLIAAGWPSQRLLLAVVITPTGQGHLVLVARTAQGDMVLDNLSDTVKPWQKTSFEWVSMQSPDNPRFWIAVGERGRQRQQKFEAMAANFN